MRRFLRYRFLFLLVGTLVAAGFSFYSDPDSGLSTLAGGAFALLWTLGAGMVNAA